MTDQEKRAILRKVESLQNSRDYAAPELEARYSAEIARLLAMLEEGEGG